MNFTIPCAIFSAALIIHGTDTSIFLGSVLFVASLILKAAFKEAE
jgi:hypothetical protein